MPARYLQMLANACQYPANAIQCHSSALQCSAMPCGLFDVAGKLRQAQSRLACPMRTCTSSISSFRGVGLLFLTQGSFRGLVRLAGAQARRLAGSQAGGTCTSVCRARRLPPPFSTPPIHHHSYRRLRALPMAEFCAMCERSACRPLEVVIREPGRHLMASTRSFLSLP